MNKLQILMAVLTACSVCGSTLLAQDAAVVSAPSQMMTFLSNGVTAHRGNSSEFAENTLAAFISGIELGVDWLELDVFRSKDGKLVVLHDKTTARVGDKELDVLAATFDELLSVDVATDFRQRTGKTVAEYPRATIPLLEDVLQLVIKQDKTRLSIQPKMDCVADTIELVKRLGAERWVGFNDGNLQFMAEAKRLAPEVTVFWDRGPDTDIDADIRLATEHGFDSLVINHRGITTEKIQKIKAAGLEVGAWTVNDPAQMTNLLQLGVERIYTDDPRALFKLKSSIAQGRFEKEVLCEGRYPKHLQGVCVNEERIFWSFTTTLVMTDFDGKLLKSIPVADHHGDLCYAAGKVYVAVNLGKFNDPNGNADSWVYVYDAESLEELERHAVQEVFHGAGGIGRSDGHFFVVGGLPDNVEENYVYEYDDRLQFVKKHVIASGHTRMGIQTATFANNLWWFGCYGDPKILLVTDASFQRLQGRFEFDCSLGIVGLPSGKLVVASGQCVPELGCSGTVRTTRPNRTYGLE